MPEPETSSRSLSTSQPGVQNGGEAGGPTKEVQVVIVPLYWKKEENQKRHVLTGAHYSEANKGNLASGMRQGLSWHELMPLKASVPPLAASRVASEHLKSKGYAVWVDLDETAMPGQKFRKWEELGVKVSA